MKDVITMESIINSLKRIDEKKKKIDAVRPLPPELVKNLQEWLAVEFTYTSNAIEGNTLTASETAMVIEKGITIAGKTIREHLEVINHAQAIDFIRELAGKKRQEIALDDILAIFPNAAKVPFLMVDFMQWLQDAQDHPVLVAALAHYKLVMIHPFVDGNGRTARLLMNLLLLQYGYPLAIIKKEQRSAYIAAIEHAGNVENYDDFYAIIISAVEYSLDIYFDAIEQSNLL